MIQIRIPEEILSSIGHRWMRNGKEIRYYVDNWFPHAKIKADFDETGAIRHVTIDGEPTSRKYFNKYIANTKVWLDSEGEVHVDYCSDGLVIADLKEYYTKLIQSKLREPDEVQKI